MNKLICIFIMGRPGAGKDTQAEILAEMFNLTHVITSALLREKFQEAAYDPVVQKEREVFESGILNTPEWVLNVVKENIKSFAQNNFENKNGIIFSGSPRTSYEVENLIPFLEKIFRKENMFAVYLDVPQEVGIERILKRAARELDKDPEKLKVRMQEYDTRTKPVLEYLKNKRILIEVDGTPSIEEIAEVIEKIVNENLIFRTNDHYKV